MKEIVDIFPLTDANNNKCCNSIEDTQILHPKDNMVQKECH